jgi:hypothetical protein
VVQGLNHLTRESKSPEFAQSLARELKQPVSQAFTRCFQNILLPGLESATQKIFAQIEEALVDRLDEIKTQITTENQSSAEISDLRTLVQRLAESQQRQEKRISELQDLLAQSHAQNMNLMQTLSSQFNGLSTQISSLSSSSMSSSTSQQPGSTSELTLEDLLALVHGNHVNQAFSAALESGRVELVEQLCAALDESAVCEGKHGEPLEDTILLSLIQQLGFSLQDPTVCLTWISEATTALNMQNPTIQTHFPKVATQVMQSLEAKFSVLPRSDPLFRPVRSTKQLLTSLLRQ